MTQDPLVEERFKLVKGEYNKILKLVDSALLSEQKEDYSSALQQYNVILTRMDTILGMNCSKVFTGRYLQESVKYQESLFDLKQNITESISRLSVKHQPENSASRNVSPLKNGEILYSINDGVQYYKVSSNGEVSIPSYPSSLFIYSVVSNVCMDTAGENMKSMLKVGDWSTVLEPGVTPVLITKQGIIMFIDQSATNQAYVGVMLPQNLSIDNRETLYSVLSALACVKIEGREEDPKSSDAAAKVNYSITEQSSINPALGRTAESSQIHRPLYKSTSNDKIVPSTPQTNTAYTVAQNISSVSEKLTYGLIKGAESAGRAICNYSDSFCRNTEGGNPSAPVDPKFQQAAGYIRTGSNGVVYASTKLIQLVGKGAKKVGTAMAPTVRKGCDQILPESWLRADPNSGNGLSKFDQATIVAGAGLAGLGQIWTGLEESSKLLGRHVVKGTSTVVQHKYGNEAGSTTTNILYSAGNIGMTGYNVGYLGPKGIAKSLATETGRAVVEQYTDEAGPNPPAYSTTIDSKCPPPK